MTEPLENILREGYGTWRKNLEISLPFFFNLVARLIVVVVLLVILLFSVLGGAAISSILSFDLIPIITSLSTVDFASIFFVIIFVGIALVILSLINSFFTAGAIGMAKEATQKGKTSLDDMLNYGKRKFVSLFFANVLVWLIVLGGAALLSGIFIGIPMLLGILSGTGSMNIPALLLFILGVIIIFLYIIITAILLSPVDYSLVISDLGAIEGIKRGYRFFMENKLHVFLLLLIIFCMILGISIVNIIVRLPFAFIPVVGGIISSAIEWIFTLISVLILAPLTTLWWTRLYLDRTGGKTSQQKTFTGKTYSSHTKDKEEVKIHI